MSKLDRDELEELAYFGKTILEEGIQVNLNKGDTRRLFFRILAANAVTYLSIIGIKRIIREYHKMADEDNKQPIPVKEAS